MLNILRSQTFPFLPKYSYDFLETNNVTIFPTIDKEALHSTGKIMSRLSGKNRSS